MKVYIDLVYLFNFYLDTMILLTTALVLKRNTSWKRILLSSLCGSITILFLFIPLSSSLLFLFKIVVALIMNIIAFRYIDLKYTISNLLYFYMISIILGGFLYYLNLEFNATKIGRLFIQHHLNGTGIFLLLISPLILVLYIKQQKKNKTLYQLSYPIKIVFKNKQEYVLNSFLDTGNRLIDPITNKPIILVEKGVLPETDLPFYYVPFHSLNNHNLLKCIKPQYVEIKNKKFNSYLIGISDKKFHLEGISCILNYQLMEELT